METGMWPTGHSAFLPTFGGVPEDMVHVPVEILIVSDQIRYDAVSARLATPPQSIFFSGSFGQTHGLLAHCVREALLIVADGNA